MDGAAVESVDAVAAVDVVVEEPPEVAVVDTSVVSTTLVVADVVVVVVSVLFVVAAVDEVVLSSSRLDVVSAAASSSDGVVTSNDPPESRSESESGFEAEPVGVESGMDVAASSSPPNTPHPAQSAANAKPNNSRTTPRLIGTRPGCTQLRPRRSYEPTSSPAYAMPAPLWLDGVATGFLTRQHNTFCPKA